MRKFTRLTTLAMFGAMVIGATGCASERGPADLVLWHNFGAAYTKDMNDSFIDPIWENDHLNVKSTSKGSYQGILEAVSGTLSTRDFPNVATGYPDHLSTYARSGYPKSPTGVLLNLNTYLDDPTLAAEHKAKTGYTFREDFYEEYMTENNTICYDDNDKQLTVGLPFNKSTEVVGYNGIFMDYAKSKDETLKVPTTWAEWKVMGPKFRKLQMELNGKYLCGTKNEEGTASGFHVETTEKDDVLLDFTEAKNEETAVLSWDSMANMFITLVRQFDSVFTSYTEEDRKQTQITDRHGYMEFYSGDNKAKTVAAMQLVRDLSGDPTKPEERIFATPTFFGGSYASDAFAENKVLFTVCSTGGLSYNLNDGQRFRVAPVPYTDADHKYVISQGANMTIFRRNCIEQPDKYTLDEMSKLAFETVIKMTTGDYQAKWATLTGYYPASRSAAGSVIYKEFINGTPDYSDIVATAYREGAQLNEKEYMNKDNHWIKFVDPGFDGSATIRDKADKIIPSIINDIDKTIDEVLTAVYNDSSLKKFVRN